MRQWGVEVMGGFMSLWRRGLKTRSGRSAESVGSSDAIYGRGAGFAEVWSLRLVGRIAWAVVVGSLLMVDVGGVKLLRTGNGWLCLWL